MPHLLQLLRQIILGKDEVLHLSLCCLLAGGHLLLEDPPGMGKTTLAEALAKVVGLRFRRIQFTSDLMPADVTGLSVYRQDLQRFEFRPGPLFTQVLLADELNRSSPRTQSALLEAMEEGQISQEGRTYRLAKPFWVIATQNPHTQAGTYVLPESQMDRFLMRLHLGYPDVRSERALLQGQDRRQQVRAITAQTNAEELLNWQEEVTRVHLSDPLLDYLMRLVLASRTHPDIVQGLSPRGALALKSAAQASAWMAGRDFVTPDDLQRVFPAVVNHRLLSRQTGQAAALLLTTVPVLP